MKSQKRGLSLLMAIAMVMAMAVPAFADDPVTNLEITGATAPVVGEEPIATITESDQYTGAVSWEPTDDVFAPATVYTATITLSPKSGYTLTGVAENAFTVTGAESSSNEADSGVITAVFPATEAEAVIDATTIGGVVAPVAGAAPAMAIAESDQYTGAVSWEPTDDVFAPATVYTATITLSPKSGYTLTGVAENAFTVTDAESSSNEADSGIITAIFPKTGAAPTYGVSLNPAYKECDNLSAGYTSTGIETITITNAGSQKVTGIRLSPAGDTSVFTMTNPLVDSLEPGASTTFTVQPQLNLNPGSYLMAVNIAGTSGSEAVGATFTVRLSVVERTAIEDDGRRGSEDDSGNDSSDGSSGGGRSSSASGSNSSSGGISSGAATGMGSTAADITAATPEEVSTSTDGKFSNVSLSAEQMSELNGKSLVLDTTANSGAILTRTWIKGGGTVGFTPGGSSANATAVAMKDLFQKWFDNVTVYTFELNQKGALGAEAHTAIWMGNSFKDTELSAYMYDITSNSYYPINCIVDSVGYIHVTYNAGGTLVFTTSPLA